MAAMTETGPSKLKIFLFNGVQQQNLVYVS